MDSRAGRSADSHLLNLQAHVGVSLPAFLGFDGGTPPALVVARLSSMSAIRPAQSTIHRRVTRNPFCRIR
jgi:hypothetical protein